MSLASFFVLVVFLGFFLLIVPVAIWLFARFFPRKLPEFIGFPERGSPSAGRSSNPGD